MEKLTKIILIIVAIYLAFQAFSLLFLYDIFAVPFQVTNHTLEEIQSYRARTLMPAFLLTLLYFIYRYFSGKNPTSALWPIYVAMIAFFISQIIGFIVYLPVTLDTSIMFIFTCVILFVVRKAHQTRKNEIF